VANLDLLEWFDEDEREQCAACDELAVVGVEKAPLFRVCLNCAAAWVEGERIDSGLRPLGLGNPSRPA
jgi:hypothetical protein